MVTQLLFGEHYEVLEEQEKWLRIKIAHDSYECWIDHKQSVLISQDEYKALESSQQTLLLDQSGTISHMESQITIVMGSVINGTKSLTIAEPNASNLVNYANRYLNTPYLWGGRTPFGIDCSGFTQMVFRLCGMNLPRDSHQQSETGEAINFTEQKVGDLAFFKNEQGKITHVGIISEKEKIIHASGKVRIDKLDENGIFNEELDKHTHNLYTIKRIA